MAKKVLHGDEYLKRLAEQKRRQRAAKQQREREQAARRTRERQRRQGK